MNKPHKHAELIKAWADGAEIQFFNYGYWHDVDTVEPRWHKDTEYRIKPKGWQQELLDAVKAGKVVEYTSGEHYWWVRSDINDYPDSYKFGNNVESQYRIRSTKKVVRWQWIICWYDQKPGITSQFLTESEAQLTLSDARCTLMQKAEWTRMEFDK